MAVLFKSEKGRTRLALRLARCSVPHRVLCRVLCRGTVALLLAGATCAAVAQGPGGGRPGGGGGGGFPGGGGNGGRPSGFPGGGRPVGGGPSGGRGGGGGTVPSPERNPLRRGPVGRWWDDSRYAQSVGLTNEQQRRMDAVFEENRPLLVSGLDTLHRAEARLNVLSASDNPSEDTLNGEIQTVAQARADLEKANTHMVLQLRNEMTKHQLKELDKLK